MRADGLIAAGDRPANLKELLLFLAMAFAILAPGIASLPPVDRDEPRYETATTQMLASRDFIDIRFQQQPRYLQPAGIYWLQALPTAVFSAPEHRQVWTYRLPSLFGAVLASLVTAWAASLMFGRRVGLSAGVLVAASMALGFEARIGKTDAALLASVALAQFALMRTYLGVRVSWRTAAMFWASVGVGVLLKGPIIIMVAGLTTLAVCLWDRKAAWLKALQPLWGLPLALVIALPWYVAIGQVSRGLFYRIAVGHSMGDKLTKGQQAHGAPFGYHLMAFPVTFWPGSLLAVMALPFVWAHRREPAVRFLVSWIVPSWLVFEIVKTKLPHYVLPTFPALACLAALALFSPKIAIRPWLKGIFFAFAATWVVLSVVLSGLAPAALWVFDKRIDPLTIVLALCSLAALGAFLWFVWRGRAERTIAAVAGVAFFTGLNAYAAGLPRLNSFWITPRVMAAAARAAPCPVRQVISIPFHEPSLVFLNGPAHTLLADTPEEAADDLAKGSACSVAIVGDKELSAFLAHAATVNLPVRPAGEVDGRNYVDNRTLKLMFYVAGK